MSKDTLRKYADQGIIPSVRTPSGQRLFDVESFTGQVIQSVSIAYARVSSAAQKPDLERQAEYLSEHATEVIKDVGSGLNYKRKGLLSILDRAIQGNRIKLVVAHRDRLARFGSELIERVIKQSGGELVVLDQTVGSSEDELTKDLLYILHVFSCRMYGRRKYKASEVKENSYLSHCTTEELIREVVRRLAESVQ